MDNDGREDLLVYRYGYLTLLRNVDGKRFEDITEKAGLKRWLNSNGAIWIDYDRDGLLDLYVTGYFRSDIDLWHLRTTRIMHNSFEYATNGGKNLLFHNLGNGKFEDVTDRMGVGSTRWTLAAASADFNEDGWPDIYLANDYGPEELYLNDHGKRFVLTTAGLESESKSGMSRSSTERTPRPTISPLSAYNRSCDPSVSSAKGIASATAITLGRVYGLNPSNPSALAHA